ncbi:MAG TPA: chromosomal replication initiator protein DnaA [Candidatus Hydrogenedentes bacterium]|nr:chromosomal replication initiator protein DnaA [Candidatus Hydrogenedentota bacterium]HPC16531.1 chromosomal replication initiator protein DnaA [Candidatus Hydrogenedentota bacterium]HRT18970.1 chromosomal replication initiator protein DnaA [Candidatus Hydrogenedentota bacterium]HRT64918.1 chromosomal replication initiator protein DnaA [Candidatus Hydrogenedentota bacterium]
MPSKEANTWELAQDYLQQVLDEHSYKNWFSQTRYESYADGELVVSVPSQFFADWLRDHYLDTITESVRKVIPDFREVRFSPSRQAVSAPAEERPVAPRHVPAPASPPVRGFNPRYTFERFVVGAGNRFAHAAAQAVADNPARAYNPLFLYGGTGLGKTHLMQAIGHAVLQRDPNANVVFISSEDFTNQLIASIAKKATQKFRATYRKADVLLIDDVHFIAGKEATQEEFFHTFNALFERHKQIVLSSDRSPKEIQGIEERLISRFGWGLITDIQAPDIETRIAILQSKAAEESVIVPAEVLKCIAMHISTNIRELEGALITVVAYSKLTGRRITIEMVEDVLADLIGKEKIKPITIEAVQRAVADHFDVRIADLCGRNRQRMVAFPRQVAMYLCKTLIPSLSLNEVGEAFGGKDHTTVLYACQKLAKEIEKSPTTRQVVQHLQKTLRP